MRVRTNVDLTNIRFNGVDYRSGDLGKYLFVPLRDQLIADTYINHALGKQAVCFCIDVEHAERMASEFNRRSVQAAHVSERMGHSQRQEILEAYQAGEIQVLCACDILNAGWDSPETEVLLMARPTLSKVIYVQQLGRGTRPAPGKEYLLVFDCEIEAIMLTKPLEKFERRLKEITVLKFAEPLWKSLTDQDKAELQKLAEAALQRYYSQYIYEN